jgi:hypothetical protein
MGGISSLVPNPYQDGRYSGENIFNHTLNRMDWDFMRPVAEACSRKCPNCECAACLSCKCKTCEITRLKARVAELERKESNG